MDLQLHFGNDDRFRMDSRFLESDSEEEQEGKCFIVQKVFMSELEMWAIPFIKHMKKLYT